MDIKPLYETKTIRLVNPVINTTTRLKSAKKTTTEYSNIPNGIAKVIQWEKIRQLFTIFVNGLASISMIIMIILFIKVFDSSWLALILPSSVGTFTIYKLFGTLLERKYLLNSVKRYSEDLMMDITTTPVFISKMYKTIIQKQIRHNWFTFFIMFYGGIYTLLLWWLKDFSWWIFKFDKWIHAWFSNPDLMTWLFGISLILTVVGHIVLAIQRKKRILEIDSYFGTTVMSQVNISALKDSENKMFRRLFMISLMIVLIIPLAVKLSLKFLRKK